MATPFRPTLESILQEIFTTADATLGGIEARLERGLEAVLLTAQAGGMHGLYGFVQRMADDRFPDSARAEALDTLGSLRGVVRGTATFSQGWIGASGSYPGVIPIGARFRTADGREYERTGSGVLPDGSITTTGTGSVDNATLGLVGTGWNVPVRAVLAGTDQSALVGTTLLFVSPISGFPSQLDATLAIAGAVDSETDASLRARILSAWRNPPQGGTTADYKAWALEASTPEDPISRAFVSPPATGFNTVTVYVVADGGGLPAANPPTPSATAIANAAAYIDARRPLASQLEVRAPTFLPINPTISLPGTLSPAQQAEIQSAITNEIDAYLIDNAQVRTATVSYELPISVLRALVTNAAGGIDASVTAPAANIVPAVHNLIHRGTITWT